MDLPPSGNPVAGGALKPSAVAAAAAAAAASGGAAGAAALAAAHVGGPPGDASPPVMDEAAALPSLAWPPEPMEGGAHSGDEDSLMGIPGGSAGGSGSSSKSL